MAEIVLHEISHSYTLPRGARDPRRSGDRPAVYALRDIELRWRDGGAYALLGPSGCGKTTLLGIISGLVHPTRGRVLYGGRDVTALSSRERNIAQVFQFPVVYDTMTVRQNLAFPLGNRGLSPGEVERRVGHIAEILELTPLLASRASQLLPDQKQILALGRGLVREDVSAILFDEPLTVIDPHRKWLLRRKLKEIHKQFHHTLIYVTHDQTEALTFADEVVVMQHGQVLQVGTPEDLFRRPARTYVGYFIGSPGMNLIPCRLEPAERTGSAQARIGEHRVALPDRAIGGEAGEFELGIRPEHIELLEDGAPGGLPLAVTAVEDHGRFRIAIAALLGLPGTTHRVKIRIADAAPAIAAGATIQVRFPPEHVCLYQDSQLITPNDAPAAGTARAAEEPA
jgi:glycerol transport system ATP-binding protein